MIILPVVLEKSVIARGSNASESCIQIYNPTGSMGRLVYVLGDFKN